MNENDLIELNTGSFSFEELKVFFDVLPFEISFVDKDDTFRYYNKREKMIFRRNTKTIGKDLRKCHPKKFLPKVEQILNDFKTGKSNKVVFWMMKEDRFVYIEYLAMRNENNEYLGTLEIVDDLTDKRKLDGEQREIVYI